MLYYEIRWNKLFSYFIVMFPAWQEFKMFNLAWNFMSCNSISLRFWILFFPDCGSYPDSRIEALQFPNSGIGMRITLHQLMVTLTYLTKCERRKIPQQEHQACQVHLHREIFISKLTMTVSRYANNISTKQAHRCFTCILEIFLIYSFLCVLIVRVWFFRAVAFLGAKTKMSEAFKFIDEEEEEEEDDGGTCKYFWRLGPRKSNAF